MTRTSSDHALADEIIGASVGMQQLRRQVCLLAGSDVNLLLEGESGTGKELVARTVHRLSARRDSEFIGVNCAAVHETLLESELFGHEAGAYTGAQRATPGLLRAAEGGTILLDEIGDMSPPLQSKLLRVLEERQITPVGGTTPVPIDIRVIAATHHDLARAVAEGTFRGDLYYRLNVVRLAIPPLRDRPEDIPPLVEKLLARVAGALDFPPKRICPQAMQALQRYGWPGNVRQLGNAIQRAYVLTPGGMIRVEDLPEEVIGDATGPADRTFPCLSQVVGRHVAKALETAGGGRSRAARLLGVDRKTLRRMIQRHNLSS